MSWNEIAVYSYEVSTELNARRRSDGCSTDGVRSTASRIPNRSARLTARNAAWVPWWHARRNASWVSDHSSTTTRAHAAGCHLGSDHQDSLALQEECLSRLEACHLGEASAL